jgi:hypothetical protein
VPDVRNLVRVQHLVHGFLAKAEAIGDFRDSDGCPQIAGGMIRVQLRRDLVRDDADQQVERGVLPRGIRR